MVKNLLLVLVVVLLTSMILSTASAELGPCTCDPSIDLDGDGWCDDCGLHIPHGDGDADGDPDQDKLKDGSCED